MNHGQETLEAASALRDTTSAAKGELAIEPMSALLEFTQCAVCGSDDHTLLFRKKENRSWWVRKCEDDPRLHRDFEFPVVRCRQCGLVFVSPRLKHEINEDIYARYWRAYEPEHQQRDEYGNYVCRQLTELGGPGDLLDFGCGWGAQLKEAEALGWRAIGLEVDERKVAYCTERGLTAVLGNLLDQPFDANSFDAVVAEQVFEHLYRPALYLRELHRLLRPGGVLYIAVPNMGGIAARVKGREWDMIHPVSHVWYFTRSTLSDFVQRHGFEVMKPLYLKRFPDAKLKNMGYAVKTLVERKLNAFPLGLAVYARKK